MLSAAEVSLALRYLVRMKRQGCFDSIALRLA